MRVPSIELVRASLKAKTRAETRQSGSGTTCLLKIPRQPITGLTGRGRSPERPQADKPSSPPVNGALQEDRIRAQRLTSWRERNLRCGGADCCRHQPMSEPFAQVPARIIAARSPVGDQVSAGDQEVLVRALLILPGLARPWSCDKSRQKENAVVYPISEPLQPAKLTLMQRRCQNVSSVRTQRHFKAKGVEGCSHLTIATKGGAGVF